MNLLKIQINKPFLQQFTHHIARYYYEIGSRWSGKTFSVIQWNIIESLQNPGLHTICARKTYASIRDSLFADYITVLQTMGVTAIDATVSPLAITYHNGSKVIFKGADNQEKLKGLSGIHRLILDELNEFTRMDFETFDLSVRGANYDHKVFLCHNPVPLVPGSQYWFQELFDPGTLKHGKPIIYEKEGLGLVSGMKTTYKNNAFVPQVIKSRLEGYKITNPDLYKLWALGEYTQIQGAIYTNWEVVNEEPNNVDCVGYGLDFGFSNDPAAMVKVWANSSEIWVKGLFYKRGLTNRDIVVELERHNVDKYDKIVADSAEPKSIEEIYRGGYRGIKGVQKRAGYKTDIINVLRGYKIYIVSGDIDLQREISTYSWQQDKEGKPLPKPQDGNDHYMDALSMIASDRLGKKKLQILK